MKISRSHQQQSSAGVTRRSHQQPASAAVISSSHQQQSSLAVISCSHQLSSAAIISCSNQLQSSAAVISSSHQLLSSAAVITRRHQLRCSAALTGVTAALHFNTLQSLANHYNAEVLKHTQQRDPSPRAPVNGGARLSPSAVWWRIRTPGPGGTLVRWPDGIVGLS